MTTAHTRTPEERHAQFAASLRLILPEKMIHVDPSVGGNITPAVISCARAGTYKDCGLYPGLWPYVFTAPEYCGHLFEAVEKLWRAAYLDE